MDEIDRERLEHALDRYGPLVFRRCLKVLGDYHEAEDAAQEVFARAWEKISTFKGDSGLGTWLYRIATNHCLNLLKKRGVGFRRSSAGHGVGADGVWRESGRVDFCEEMIRKVDREMGEIAFYYFVDGMTQDEVAEAMSLSRRTVGKKLKCFEDMCRRAFCDES